MLAQSRKTNAIPLCSAPIRPHPGTSPLGSQRQADKPEELREGKKVL